MDSSRDTNGALSRENANRRTIRRLLERRLDPDSSARGGERIARAPVCPSYNDDNQVRSSSGTERTDSIRDRSALAKRQLHIIELE